MNFSEAMYRLCELLGEQWRAKNEIPEIQSSIWSEIRGVLEELPLEGKSVPCELCNEETPCTQLSAHPEACVERHPRLICVDCAEKVKPAQQVYHEEEEEEEEEYDYYADDDRDDYCDDYTGLDDDDEPLCPCGDDECYGGCGVLPCGCIDVHKDFKHAMRAALGVA